MNNTLRSQSTNGADLRRRWVLPIIVIAICMSPLSASAADYYWDADPAANNLTTGVGLGGAGVWNASNLNWWDTTTSADVVWPGAAHRAVFWGTAGLVAVNDMSASGLLIKSTLGSYSLTGNGGATTRTLTLGSEGVTMESGAAATTLGNNTGNGKLLFALSANQTWLNSSANALTVNGTVNVGALTLTLDNGSTGGQVFNQAFVGTGGVVIDSAGSGETLFSAANSGFGGTITIKRGTLVAGNSAFAIGAAGSTVTLGGGSDDATLRFQNTQNYVAKIAVAAGAGKRTISASTGGSSSVISGGIAVDNDLNLRIAGPGTLNITGSLTGAGNILVDAATGADGYIQLAVSNTAYSGNVTLRSGLVRAASFNAALGSGTVYLGDSTTAGDALLQYTTNNTFTTPVVVAAGSGARAIIGPNSGTNVTIAGPITLNNDLRLLVAYTSTRNAFLSSAISGDHTITVSRMTSTAYGGFNISGNSSGFTGTWRVEGDAKLYLGAATAIGAADVDVILNGGTLAYVNGGTMDLGSTRNIALTTTGGNFQSGEAFTSGGGSFEVGTGLQIGGVVSGGGGLLKTGVGILTLSNAANTYSGGTTIAAGTLIAKSLGSGGVTLSDATTLISLGSFTIPTLSPAGTNTISTTDGNIVVSGAVAGSGNLNLSGGALTLSGDGSGYTGLINLASGTLNIGGGGATGSISATSIINNGAVVFNRSNAYSFTGQISGTGSVSITGGGSITLAGNNAYTGATSVAAGTLQVTGTLGNTAVTIANGATLNGTGTLGGMVSNSGTLSGGLTIVGVATNQVGSAITPGTLGTVGTLTLGGLVLNGGSLNFDLGATGIGNSDYLAISGGSFNVSGATTLTFNALGGFGVGTYNLFGGYSGAISGFNLLSAPSLYNNFALTLTEAGGFLQLLVSTSGGSGPSNLVWTGASDSNWNLSSANWTGATTFSTGDNVTFDNTTLTGAVTITAAGVAPGSIVVNNDAAHAYTFSGGPITGTASLLKQGSGTLTLAGSHAFTGPTTVQGGTLQLGGDYASSIHLQNALLQLSTTGNQTLSGILSGSGFLQKLGSGTTTLLGVNTFSGITSVDAGTLTVNHALSGTVFVNAGGAFSGTGASLSHIIVQGGSGSISGTHAGPLDVSSGNVTIASGGATTGTVALSGGQLIVASGGQLGNTQGVNVSGGTLNVQTGGQIVGNGQINVAGTLNANGEVQGLVTVNSGGVLKGNGTVGGVVLQSGGTLAVGNSVGALTIDGGPGGGPALTLNAGSIIEFEFNNVSGGPGVGWDYLELGGGLLTINATNNGPNDQVEVHVNSLTLNDSTHGANNFNAAAGTPGSIQEYYWKFIGLNNLSQISTTGSSSVGGRFQVIDDLVGAGVFDTTDGNPYDRPLSSLGQGTFKVLAGDFGQGTGLYIYYSAVPEPGSMLLAGLGSIAAGWYGRRKLRRKQDDEVAMSETGLTQENPSAV